MDHWSKICEHCGQKTSKLVGTCQHCGKDTRSRCTKCRLPFHGQPPLCRGHSQSRAWSKARPAGGMGHGHLRRRRMAWGY